MRINVLMFSLILFGTPLLSFSSDRFELDAFDGTVTSILGPLDIPVPKSFFTECQQKVLVNGLNYHASFTLDSINYYGYELEIQNERGESSAAPVTVSLVLPNGDWHNFIVNMPTTNQILLGLDSKVKELIDMYNDEESEKGTITGFVISGDPIRATLKSMDEKSEFAEDLEIIPPKAEDTDQESKTALASACTSNGGYMDIRLIDNLNHGTTNAYLFVTLTKYIDYTFQQISYWSSIEIDYPFKGNTFHMATNVLTSKTWLNGTCMYPEYGYHRTQTWSGEVCNYDLQTHSWSNIKNLTQYSSSATARATSGCQSGRSWKVVPR